MALFAPIRILLKIALLSVFLFFWKCVRVGVSRLSSPSFLVLVLLLLLFSPFVFWFGGQDPAVETCFER